MSDFEDFKATYFDECSELLGELEEQFAAIEAGARDAGRLNAVFRAIHSIKGGAGAFGFAGLVEFAHAFESLLDHVRDGRVELTDEVVALCIRANDIVADFVAAARADERLEDGYGAEEKARFVVLAGDGDPDDRPLAEGEAAMEDFFDIDFTPVRVFFDEEPAADPVLPEDSEAPSGPVSGHWEVTFRPHRALYAHGNDPLLLVGALAAMGEARVTAELDSLPVLDAFDPYGVYCAWRIELFAPDVSEAAIREVFEFVEDDCTLAIRPVAPDAPADPAPEASGSLADLAALLGAAPAPAPTPAPSLPVRPLAAAPDAQEGEGRPAGVQSIRVDLDKVDRVVNMVSELVITQSMLTQQMDDTLRAQYQELVRGLEILAQTTRGLQDSVMAIRAQPVKSVFSRMPRLVRELAAKTGKKMRIETVGEHTEIDKTVIEQLSDPLTHMIRNSADHGIESPADRLAAGKPETGTIRLSAEQAGGNILIVVEDDGAGIDREKVLGVARERGVVSPDQALSDDQIDNLIFAPGFSTATAVSDISGRGVGMDVVLANIKKIGGVVQVRSRAGRGTRMTLRLPLTLAVLDVMLVTVAGSPYVIPLSSILETIQCARAEFGRVPGGGRVMQVRGDYVEVIDLAQRFGMAAGLDTEVGADERFVVLCEAEGDTKVALVVEGIVGQQQVVIKSLEENFERIEGIAGGTILGDGSVALIVDVQGIRSGIGHASAA